MLARRVLLAIPLLACVVFLVVGQAARAAVLYDENFTGPAATTLNGQIPDVDQNGGFNQWRAHSGFVADGSMTVPSGGSGAYLPFIPQAGFTYTLSATFIGVVGDGNWMAIGFGEAVPANPQATGNPNRFISDPTTGKAWMLCRGNNSANPNQTLRGDAGSGTLAAGTESWQGGPTDGGDIDLQIVLNTTAGAGGYTATFFAKRPTDGSYTQVSSGALLLNHEGIGSVGFAGSNAAIDSTITNFTLETTGPVVVPGDVNGDGFANAADFNVIRDNFFNSVTSRTMGDLTSDGIVNFADFRAWKNAASAEVVSSVAGSLVPEPASLGLAGFACVALAALRRRYVTAVRSQS